MKAVYSVFFIFICTYFSFGQTGRDSLTQGRDTAVNQVSAQTAPGAIQANDSAKRPAINSIPLSSYEMYLKLLGEHPYFNFFGPPKTETVFRAADRNKDGIFYLLAGLVMYFALLRLFFYKYMSNLFTVFFRVSLKQKQIREQLLQSTLPSLLLNIYFLIAGGIYITFLLDYYHFNITPNKWYLMLYCTISLALIYIFKLLVLKFIGWILHISVATETYIFVVFLVNKMLGIFLTPFLVLLAFSSQTLVSVFVVLSFTMVVIFLAYRYIIAYSPVRKEIKVSQFHFFLYLCAFEIMPLLLIYKVLFTYLERST